MRRRAICRHRAWATCSLAQASTPQLSARGLPGGSAGLEHILGDLGAQGVVVSEVDVQGVVGILPCLATGQKGCETGRGRP